MSVGGRPLASENEDERVLGTISYYWRSATLPAAFGKLVTIDIQHMGTQWHIPESQAVINATKVTDAELGLHRTRHPLPRCQSTVPRCSQSRSDVLFLASRMPDTGNTHSIRFTRRPVKSTRDKERHPQLVIVPL